jgi:hypothetical protein
MAVNSVIVYFPWGAGGNLVRNVIGLSTEFEFIDDQLSNSNYPTLESRYQYLVEYYQKPVTSEDWLQREWAIRQPVHNRYFSSNGIGYWNPDYKLVYDIHGTEDEINSILADRQLECFDRSGIAEGRIREQLSPWTVQQCNHVFLLPNNLAVFNKIYTSKNPKQSLNVAATENAVYVKRLQQLVDTLKSNHRQVSVHQAELLFCDTGYLLLEEICSSINLSIPLNFLKDIHAIWLQSTRDLYYNTHNKLLEI